MTTDELSQQIADCTAKAKALMIERNDLLHTLKAASQALKSYAYSNAATDLAVDMAALCDAAIARAEAP